MKTMTAMMILVFALYFSGCATTQGGGQAPSIGKSDSGSAPAKSGGMLTKEDYERMGIREMGAK